MNIVISRICENFNHRMYEVSPSILEARLLDSGNQILDAAVVGIPNQDNGQVTKLRYKIKITMTQQNDIRNYLIIFRFNIVT